MFAGFLVAIALLIQSLFMAALIIAGSSGIAMGFIETMIFSAGALVAVLGGAVLARISITARFALITMAVSSVAAWVWVVFFRETAGISEWELWTQLILLSYYPFQPIEMDWKFATIIAVAMSLSVALMLSLAATGFKLLSRKISGGKITRMQLLVFLAISLFAVHFSRTWLMTSGSVLQWRPELVGARVSMCAVIALLAACMATGWYLPKQWRWAIVFVAIWTAALLALEFGFRLDSNSNKGIIAALACGGFLMVAFPLRLAANFSTPRQVESNEPRRKFGVAFCGKLALMLAMPLTVLGVTGWTASRLDIGYWIQHQDLRVARSLGSARASGNRIVLPGRFGIWNMSIDFAPTANGAGLGQLMDDLKNLGIVSLYVHEVRPGIDLSALGKFSAAGVGGTGWFRESVNVMNGEMTVGQLEQVISSGSVFFSFTDFVDESSGRELTSAGVVELPSGGSIIYCGSLLDSTRFVRLLKPEGSLASLRIVINDQTPGKKRESVPDWFEPVSALQFLLSNAWGKEMTLAINDRLGAIDHCWDIKTCPWEHVEWSCWLPAEKGLYGALPLLATGKLSMQCNNAMDLNRDRNRTLLALRIGLATGRLTVAPDEILDAIGAEDFQSSFVETGGVVTDESGGPSRMLIAHRYDWLKFVPPEMVAGIDTLMLGSEWFAETSSFVSDKAFLPSQELNRFTSLEQLYLGANLMDDYRVLEKMPKLKVLQIPHEPHPERVTAMWLSLSGLASLETLIVIGEPGVNEIFAIKNLPALRELVVCIADLDEGKTQQMLDKQFPGLKVRIAVESSWQSIEPPELAAHRKGLLEELLREAADFSSRGSPQN